MPGIRLLPLKLAASCLCGALLATTATAQAPLPALVRATGPEAATVESANITTEVYFDAKSTKLSAQAKAGLDKWLQSTQGIKPDFILSIGHTDLGEATNALKCVKLSEARGEAVRAYLATKGIDATKVYVEGKGDTQPVAATNALEERAKNRRVDLGMIGKRE